MTRLLARKITKGIHSCKPASLNRTIMNKKSKKRKKKGGRKTEKNKNKKKKKKGESNCEHVDQTTLFSYTPKPSTPRGASQLNHQETYEGIRHLRCSVCNCRSFLLLGTPETADSSANETIESVSSAWLVNYIFSMLSKN